MLAFLPVPPPPDDAGIRLDVRLENGPARGYALGEGEFLIGTAAGCDLRLAGSQYPPVICQFSRADDGLRVRKLSPTVPVYLNEKPLSGSAPVTVEDGDIVRAGPAEIVVHSIGRTFPRPKLVTFEEEIPDAIPVDDLTHARAELAEQLRELEEDRALWYRRKMEMEAELRGVPDAAELVRRERAVAARESELQHEFDRRFAALESEIARRRAEVEAELTLRRQKADDEFRNRMEVVEDEIGQRRLQLETDLREYEPRLIELRTARERIESVRAELDSREASQAAQREELKRERESIDDERKWQFVRLKELDGALLERHAELARREGQLRAELEQFAAERDRHKDDLLRFDRAQAELERRLAAIDGRTAEVNERHGLLERTSFEWEETVRLADAEQTRVRAEAERLEKLQAEIDRRNAELNDRGAIIESQAAALAMLRANLSRQHESIQNETVSLANERAKFEGQRQELDARLRAAELARAELGQARDIGFQEVQTASERNALLAAQIEELRTTEARVREREIELDARSSEFAEQVSLLKSRIAQAMELQERLELDRESLKAREALLGESDSARLEFQEQLRKRAEELARRSKEVDELRVKLAEEHAVLKRLREGLEAERSRGEQRFENERLELDARAKELDDRVAALAERETALERQVARLQEAGESVANERKALVEARELFETERAQAVQFHLSERQESDELRSRIAAHFAEMRAQAPDLEQNANASLERLAAARDVLRGNLTELHEYAKLSREELESERSRIRIEADQIRAREHELETARSEHRLAVSGFRQQLLDWQSKIGELKTQFDSAQSRIERRGTDVDSATREIEELREDLIRQTQEVAAEKRKAVEKRTEMERHLGDMREWYRRKLRELAAGRQVDETDMPDWKADGKKAPVESPTLELVPAEPEPGDQHLGDLLIARGLVDANTLAALGEESRRQRKSLRQTLLASGALTLYQLALIEAGTLDGLMLGRLRVVDRVRVTSKEAAYRVFDPTRPGGPTRGIYVLRHLAEAEMQDAVRPDEFRQRFATMAQSTHPNLANTLEMLEIQGRPAALQEWVAGLASTDWPPVAATPGTWVRLMAEAAKGINHAHRAGLYHGRLAADSFVLSPEGTLKILGYGEPYWLAGGAQTAEPTPAADLRALGRIGFGWSQLGSRRRGARPKPFPSELTNVIRRLETGAEPSMGDVVAIDRPYSDAGDLLRDLARLVELHPCPPDAWEKFVRYAAENSPDVPVPLRTAG